MATPGKWKKVVDDGDYHTGGNIFVDMQRWRYKHGDLVIIVEAVVGPEEQEGINEGGGDVTITVYPEYDDDLFNYTEHRMVLGGHVPRSRAKKLVRKQAVAWMEANRDPENAESVDDLRLEALQEFEDAQSS